MCVRWGVYEGDVSSIFVIVGEEEREGGPTAYLL